MIGFYGVMHLLKSNPVSELRACPHCGRYQRMRSQSALEVFHISFIPLIPLGRMRVVYSCPGCLRHYPFNAKGKELRSAIAEARQFAREAETVDELIDRATYLTHLGDSSGADDVLSEWAISDPTGAEIVRGRCFQLRGDFTEAERRFREAISSGDDAETRYWMGRFLLDTERDEEALAELRTAHELADDLDVAAPMWDALAARHYRRRWDSVFLLTEELLRLDPKLAHDAALVKLNDKAARKSGNIPSGPTLASNLGSAR